MLPSLYKHRGSWFVLSLSSLTERLFIRLGKGPTLDERTLLQTALWIAIANSVIYYLLPIAGLDTNWNLRAILGFGLLLVLARWAGAFSFGTHALLVLEFAQLASLSAHSGGINSPYIACMPLLPISALLLLNMRWALVWLAIISIQNYFQYLALSQNWIAGAVNPQTFSVNSVLIIKVSSLVFLVLALSLYDWTYRRKMYKLAIDNQELNSIEAALRQVQIDIDALATCIDRDIRAPIEIQRRLSPILIAELANSPGHLDAAQQMRAETSQLCQSVQDFGDFVSLERGHMDFALSFFYVPDVLLSAVAAIKAGPHATRCPVNVDLDPSIQIWAHAGRDRLMQIVTRLLLYAGQHADSGSIQVRAHFADTRVRVEVQFSPQDASIVSTPRAMVSNGPPEPTTHLGLAVCLRLAAAAGGQFCFYRRGPTKHLLWLEWPLSVKGIAAFEPYQDTSLTATPPVRRFLVVEHILSTQLEIQALLKKRWPQCHVGLAESASNALLQLEFSHYDMVLINISLPQTDGLQATQQIRAHAMPGIRSTPVVGLATKSEASARQRCLSSGMQWVLFKPLESDVFFAAITAHLAGG